MDVIALNHRLNTFLENKPLYYTKIDLERMPNAYAEIKDHLKVPRIIHVVGTNGKGTTGRYLSTALYKSGYSVGHYSSPHILEFNERIWIDGEDSSEALLNQAHQKLQSLLSVETSESLSYFEYTTLLAMFVYETCDFVVLEAGLGGEFDATNVFEKELSIFTPIDFDHEAFLGSSLEDIASTKLRSMRQQALIGKQKHEIVLEIADTISDTQNCRLFDVETLLGSEDILALEKFCYEEKLPAYIEENLALVCSALRLLDIQINYNDFKEAKLFGRQSWIEKNICVDVGHNLLASEAILSSFHGRKVILVYNSFEDKAYKAILATLKPIIKHVEILKVDDNRIEKQDLIESALNSLQIKHKIFNEIDKEETYLVFGSFSVVEAFLKQYKK